MSATFDQIPQFGSLTHLPQPGLQSAGRAGRQPATEGAGAQAAGQRKAMSLAPAEPMMLVSEATSSSFVFELRSRVNARMLVGGPIAHGGDLDGKVAQLLDLCRREEAFRVEHRPEGNLLRLFDDEGHEVAVSEPIGGGEALTQAMLKLVATQARRARVVHKR